MKKLILSLIVIASFMMGNLSMVATIIRIFGKDALIPVVKDLVGQKVDTILWGGAPPARRRGIGLVTNYTTEAIARERRLQDVAGGGPILKPTPGMPSRRQDTPYGPLR